MSRFESKISCHGPGGNIMDILGKARSMLRMLKIPQREIDDLSEKVMTAPDYKTACDYVREYFPLEEG